VRLMALIAPVVVYDLATGRWWLLACLPLSLMLQRVVWQRWKMRRA
jgi:hypothetical protein